MLWYGHSWLHLLLHCCRAQCLPCILSYCQYLHLAIHDTITDTVLVHAAYRTECLLIRSYRIFLVPSSGHAGGCPVTFHLAIWSQCDLPTPTVLLIVVKKNSLFVFATFHFWSGYCLQLKTKTESVCPVWNWI